MRAAVILGLGCSAKQLKPFQTDDAVEWRMGVPASHEDADAILLFGGDGTIHRHLGQLVKLGLPLLVVPAGSGNDFARALGVRSVRDSLAAWKRFYGGGTGAREIDLGVISTSRAGAPSHTQYFCGVAGIGLDGEVARRANELPRWLRGHGGYVLSLVPTIFSFAPFSMKIFSTEEAASSRDGKPWVVRNSGPTLLAAFANAPLYGGGMKVAPRARMDDGMLDVCVVGGISPFKLFCMFPTVYAGRHLKIRDVNYFQSSNLRVETEHPLDVYADGEYVCSTPAEISVQRAALKVITPYAESPFSG